MTIYVNVDLPNLGFPYFNFLRRPSVKNTLYNTRGLRRPQQIQGDFFHWYPPEKLKYVKPRLGESMLTKIGPDTPNLA